MKAAVYARVSSDAQDVSLSIGAQLRAIREFAANRGYEVVREFIDEAESGRTAARPAFKEMIALAKTKQPPFETILVWKLNRFARSRVDSITYKELLRQRGIKVISITEPLEDSPSGKLLEGVLESIDEFYSANLGQDIKRGIREAARRGFFVGSRPPPGLHRVPVKDGPKTRYTLEPDPDDSATTKTVRRIFDMAAKNIGTKDIAKTLNHDGFFTSTGQHWGKTTVHKILTNEAYCGTLVLGGRPGHLAIRSGEPPVRLENAWPSLIDKGIFLSVQAKMAAKRPLARHPRTVPSFYLLSGLLFCSCGRAMIGRSAKSHHYYYYTCNRRFKQGSESCGARALPKEQLERLVIGQIKDRILNDEWLEELVKLVNQELDSSYSVYHERLEVIDAELKDVRSRLDKLYDALETGKLSMDDLAPRIKELKTRMDELSKIRLMIEADLAVQGVHRVDRGEVIAYADDMRSLLGEADIVQSKAFLRTFVKKIVVESSKVKVFYNLPVPVGHNETKTEEVLPIVTPGGAEGTRTPYLLNANESLSLLSYSPSTLIIITCIEIFIKSRLSRALD